MIRTKLGGSVSNLAVGIIHTKLIALGGTQDRDGRGDQSQSPGSNLLNSAQVIELKGSPSLSSVTTSAAPALTLTCPRHSFVAVVL